MSFHPESKPGWKEGMVCPYCGSGDIEYTGNTKGEYGCSDCYDVTDGTCAFCGKAVKIVEIVTTEIYGCYKGDDGNDSS